MTSTFTPSLLIEEMATGDQSGTWGDTTNNNFLLFEQAITGVLTVAQGDTTLTLTSVNGSLDQARNAVLEITGALTAARDVIVPAPNKLYLVKNLTTGGFNITVRTASGTGVAIIPGTSQWVYSNGTNVIEGLVGTFLSADVNNNLVLNNFIAGYATTVTTAGTTVLTVASAAQQYFTGTTTQTVTMPAVATLVLGQAWKFVNQSTGAITINSSGANQVLLLSAGTSAVLTCIAVTGTDAASWSIAYAGAGTILSNLTGSAATPVNNALVTVLTALNSSATSPLAGLRNHLINGTMQVWQRGTSFSISSTTPGYTADRWAVSQGSGTVALTVAQEAAPATGVKFSQRVQRNSANTNTAVIHDTQVIEGLNCADLQGQPVTFSFYAKAGANYSAASSNLVSAVITGTGADQGLASMLAGTWTGQATSATQSNTLTTTRTKFTMPVTIPTGATEIAVDFGMTPVGTAGAADYFEIDSIQFEPGAVATPIEQRSVGLELVLSQRYARLVTTCMATAFAANDISLAFDFSGNQMRVTPSVALVTPGSMIGNGAATAVSALTGFSSGTPTGFGFDVSMASNLTSGFSYIWRSGTALLTSEL